MRVSVDEYLTKRSIAVNSAGMISKIFKSPATWNADERTARFVMSSETPDRMRDVVRQRGMDKTEFERNPQGLLFHDSRNFPIGLWENVATINGSPKRTEGTIRLLPEGADEIVDRTAKHIAFGTLRTSSIGFIPLDIERIMDSEGRGTGGFDIVQSELVECSIVPIPANPDAIVKAADGDFKMAYELIEEVLDTYTRDSSGLIVPRETYEQKRIEIKQRITLPDADSFKVAPTEIVPIKTFSCNIDPNQTTQNITHSIDDADGYKSIDVSVTAKDSKAVRAMSERFKEALEGIFGAKAEHHDFGTSLQGKFHDAESFSVTRDEEDGAMYLRLVEDSWPQTTIFTKELLAAESTSVTREDDDVVIVLENASAKYAIIYETPHEVVGKLTEGTVDVPETKTVPGSRSLARSRTLNLKAEAARLGL